jgi:hypothetical protein
MRGISVGTLGLHIECVDRAWERGCMVSVYRLAKSLIHSNVPCGCGCNRLSLSLSVVVKRCAPYWLIAIVTNRGGNV